jgi:hypothetical protein
VTPSEQSRRAPTRRDPAEGAADVEHVAPAPSAVGRRDLVAAMLATAGAAFVGCSNGDSGASHRAGNALPDDAGLGGTPALPEGLAPEGVPATDTIHRWIEQVVERGIRRPGYEADVWTEQFVADRFRELGLERVRLEPVPVTRWEPRSWRLEATPDGHETRTLDCFPVPYTAPVDGLELELAAYDTSNPGAVTGKAALYDARVARLPPTALVSAGSAPDDLSNRVYDPEGTFEGDEHVLPHTAERRRILDPSIDAGAAAFVGALVDYPGDGCRYYVPYDGQPRHIPGVWVRGSDGAWLHDQLGRGAVHVRLTVDSTTEPFESHNVVGELPGPDDDVVMVGSHHDGPWASAVEDASGVALVLAQAAFWAAQPRERRPHRMVFVLQAGHVCGGAGLRAYIEAHHAELSRVVLEVHLEHAAREVVDQGDGELVTTGQCTPRWFFTSRVPPLEAAVAEALATERLNRSMILAPDALGDHPPTDGGGYHSAGIPVVQFLAAPWYLFDPVDQLDKIDRDNLVPLTRATVRILHSTRGFTAATMRR